MKSFTYLLGTALVVGAAASASAQSRGDKIEGSYICVFKPGAVAKGNVRAEANRAASNGGGQVVHVYDTAIRGFSANMSDAGARQVAARNPKIAFCEQDQVMTTSQSALDFRTLGKPAPAQPTQSPPWGVIRVKGGAGTGAGGGTAWVIDTGIDLDHPDLRVDSGRSRSFTRESTADDGNGHGTHVAGTIGALDNSIGVIGVSPGANLVAVKVLTRNGSGSNSGVIAGVDYVAANGVGGDVANMSLGGGPSDALDAAVKCAADGVGGNCSAAGVVKFTLAAGNESESATLHSPARANGANIYTVSSFAKGTSATDTEDPWSSFSNFGNPPVDYAEPGSSIPSTYKDGGYATLSGTSMAAPHLAGILLVRSPQGTTTVDSDPDGNADPIGEK